MSLKVLVRSLRLAGIVLLFFAAPASSAAENERPTFRTRQPNMNVQDAVVSEDGKWAAIASGASVGTEVRQMENGLVVANVAKAGRLAISADGRRVLVATSAGEAVLWKAEDPQGSISLFKTYSALTAVAISADGSMGIFGDRSGKVSLVDLRTGIMRCTAKVDDAVNSVEFFKQDARALVVYGSSSGWTNPDSGSAMLDLGDCRAYSKITAPIGHPLTSGAISSDGGRVFAIADASSGLLFWNIRSGARPKMLMEKVTLTDVVSDRTGKTVLVMANDLDFVGLISFNVDTGLVNWRSSLANDRYPHSFGFVEGGKSAFESTLIDGVRLHDARDGLPRAAAAAASHVIPVTMIQASGDDRYLLPQNGRDLLSLWDLDGTVSFRARERGPGALESGIPEAFAGHPWCDRAVMSPAADVVTLLCASALPEFSLPSLSRRGTYAPPANSGFQDISGARYSPDGSLFAASTELNIAGKVESDFIVWKSGSNTPLWSYKFDYQRYSLYFGFSKDHQSLWVMTGAGIYGGPLEPEFFIFDAASGRVLLRQQIPCRDINMCYRNLVSVSQDGSAVGFVNENDTTRPRSATLWFPATDPALKHPVILPAGSPVLAVNPPVFSNDLALAAYRDSSGTIYIYDVSARLLRRKITGDAGGGQNLRNSGFTFSHDGTGLFVGTSGGTLFRIDLVDANTPWIEFRSPDSSIKGFVEANRHPWLFAASGTGILVFNAKTGEAIATAANLSNGDWVAIARDGHFDGTGLETFDSLNWVMPDDARRALPFEIFMRDYYEPRLTARLLHCGEDGRSTLRECAQTTETSQALSLLNRIQPGVEILSVVRGQTADEAVVTVEPSSANDPTQPNNKTQTDAYDLRLFRDGQLVGRWPEGPEGGDDLAAWRARTHIDMPPGETSVRHAFTVKLPTGKRTDPVAFTAYAFNEDRVKSATARADFSVPANVAARKPRAYVVTIGVDGYEAPSRTLKFAVRDAEAMAQALGQLQGYEVIPVSLTSGADRPGWRATKANIRDILARLAGKTLAPGALADIPGAERLAQATPDDLVVITYSGHGYTERDGGFYLLPSDSGVGTSIDAAALASFVSSEELSEWLRPIDAGQMAMIIDACHAAASIEQPGFKPGPMGDRGLGQLAYDKAMRILAASQAADVALESERLKQGLLTYALVHDGLALGPDGKRAADLDHDGRLTLAEWLRYGEQHTPTLYEDIRTGRKDVAYVGRDAVIDPRFKDSVVRRAQTPALFDFTKGPQADAVIP